MNVVITLLIITIVLVVAAFTFSDKGSPNKAIASSVAALLLLLLLVFNIIPDELGYSRVPNVIEAFTKRLEVGVVYEVDAIIKPVNATDYEKIIIVHSSLKNYRAIRVRVFTPIPTRFTLIDGQPVEVK